MPAKESPRIVYMGTPEFAVEPLKSIIEAGYNVSAVITVPDKPAGRGLKLHPSPVKVFAKQNHIPVLQPEKLKDQQFIQTLKELNPDIAVVVAFRMLPRDVWQIPHLGTFNLHASLLPQYRGAAPINWAIINGEKETGVTTFLLDDQIDTGSILLQKRIPIGETETAGELHNKLMYLGASLVVETINMLYASSINPIPQNQIKVDGELKPAPKIFKETCRVDWNNPSPNVFNHIRGLSPYPAAWAEFKTNRSNVETIKPIKIYQAEKLDLVHSQKPGTVKTDGKTFFHVFCSQGALALKTVQQAGKKAMGIDEFLRGWHNTQFIEML
ncbi:MAG TPA: methionyl-tRNA formyltransferase [Bacteroidales bacterium]|nr:methionyl-tRNA formyltransferase [Bacteroidales bacterium]